MGQILCVKKVHFRKSGHIYVLIIILIHISKFQFTGKHYTKNSVTEFLHQSVVYTQLHLLTLWSLCNYLIWLCFISFTTLKACGLMTKCLNIVVDGTYIPHTTWLVDFIDHCLSVVATAYLS